MGTDVAMQSAVLGHVDTALPARSRRLDDRRAIAVLPFLNFSDDPEQEYFADGITEDIISLARATSSRAAYANPATGCGSRRS